LFQAEDGIRDATVTGVQTCALPISPGSEVERRGFGQYRLAGRRCRLLRFLRGGGRRGREDVHLVADLQGVEEDDGVGVGEMHARSEERRVGKWWRGRARRGCMREHV